MSSEELDLIRRYLKVARGEEIPLFVVAKHMPSSEESDPREENLERTIELLELVRKGEHRRILKETPKFSLLDLKHKIAEKLVESCKFCEMNCAVNRRTSTGVCGVGYTSRVASAFLHLGEEPPLVPSGTIFFSGCNFHCIYCQNWDISRNPGSGASVGPRELASIMLELERRGAININLVGGDPTPNIHTILGALRVYTGNLPIIWNSNLYLTPETLELLVGVVDLWLPDFKYWDDAHAMELSRARNYREILTRNLRKIYELGGEIIIRHLVLPGHLECCTMPILRWIRENIPNTLVNVMGQYRPEYKAHKHPILGRRISLQEVLVARGYADELRLNWRSVS